MKRNSTAALGLSLLMFACSTNPAETEEHKQLVSDHQEMEAAHEQMETLHNEMESLHSQMMSDHE